MSEEIILPQDTFNIVTWNILLDYTRTKAGLVKRQDKRADSLIAKLNDLRDEIGELDAVAIQEGHKSDRWHNGEYIARALGYGIGQWFEHNKKPFVGSKTGRPDEYMGMFGARIDHAEPVELGDNRKAVLSHIGKTAVLNIHTRAGILNENLQVEQVRVALGVLAGYKSAALVGDLNNQLGGKVHQAIEADGFESVFTSTHQVYPGTWPTEEYRRIMLGAVGQHVIPTRSYDAIYTKGLYVHDAGSFTGDTDHVGLYAKVGQPELPA